MDTETSPSADFSWPASLREAGLLLLVAVVITAGSWLLRPDGLTWQADPETYELELAAPLIGTKDALDLYDAGIHLYIDTRVHAEGDFETIPGAFFVREASFDDDLLEYFDFMTTEDYLILFGGGDLFPVSNLAARLKDRGYSNVLILKGGLGAWKNAGGEISQRSGGES